MNAWLKIVAAALLTAPLAALTLDRGVAQTADSVPSTSIDAICDYCRDFGDAATSAGAIRSEYRPGLGYPAKAAEDPVTARELRQEEAALRVLRKRPGTQTQ